ncbi:unnamed protein product [Symbiodinium natans]|uniref:Pentatricopeptide repeat-containing protein, chloroplastic n=1 Tax=Symbiodinium natans TaxID=878477 RepID=A0A812R2H8_9DINO|nr:unnamed protein product [Symbiodinium natans]
MRSRSLQLNRTSCNSLLKAWTFSPSCFPPPSHPAWAIAMSQLMSLAQMKIRGDGYTLTTIGAACASTVPGNQQWQHAGLLHGLNKRQANSFSHNSLLSTCEKANCWELVMDMVRDPSLPSPTTISFNTALVASGSADGNWQHSLCMLSSMAAVQLRRSIVSHNALGTALQRVLRWPQVLVFMDLSRAAALVPDGVSILTLVSSRASDWKMAALFLEDKASAEPFKINVLNAMVDALREALQWRFGLSLLCVMAEVRALQDRVTSNTLMTVLGEVACWQLSLSYFSSDVHPADSFSTTAMATGFAAARRWQGGLDMVSKLGQLRTSLSESGMTAAITACLRHWRRGLGLLSKPNAVNYNAALACTATSSDWHAATHRFEVMQLLRLVADILSHTAVLDSCVQPSLWRSSLLQREHLQMSRMKLDRLSLSACVSACELASQQA